MTTTTVPAGLDLERLQCTLESIVDFARRELPDRLLIELDERGEFPEALVRRIRGEQLGAQLLFIAEEHGGGAALDVYRVCERRAEPGWVMVVAGRPAPGPPRRLDGEAAASASATFAQAARRRSP